MSHEEPVTISHENSPTTDTGKDVAPLLTSQSPPSTTETASKRHYYWIGCIAAIFALSIIAMVVIVAFVFRPSAESNGESNFQYDRYLIVISLDGYRADYFNDPNISSPHLREMAENGVHIERLIPVFPSMTFPNHYSIVTGLYPGDHGIVGNSFYDPILDDTFFMWTDDTKGDWYRGEPIWMTHRMPQNIDSFGDYQSATVFWVGSDHNCSGRGYPDFYMNYNGSYPFRNRVDTILDLLRDGSYRLIMGYMSQPDSDGHEYGPQSEEVKQSVAEVDAEIGYLVNGIKDISMELFDRTDIVVVADHGMTEVSNESLIYVNHTADFDLLDDTNFILDARSSSLFIKLKENSTFTVNEVMMRLEEVVSPLDLVGIYDRESIPYEYKSGYHDRIPDVTVAGPNGYQFSFVGQANEDQYWLSLKGNHGFNNTVRDMSALFVARGPSFKSNYTMQKTENINLYSLFCHLMDGMSPSPNNGSLDDIADILM